MVGNLYRNRLVNLGLLMFATLLGGGTWLHFSETSLYGDSGAFVAVAKHLLLGKVLYRDVWDMKPPGIFLILAMLMKGSAGSLKVFHFVQALMVGFCSLLLLSHGYKRNGRIVWFILPLVPVWLYSWMNWTYYQNGFFTEEYGSYFLFFSALLLLKGGATRYYFLAGILAALAFLCKELFAFPCLGLIAFLIAEERPWKMPLIWFVAGACAMLAIIVVWLVYSGAWSHYLDYLQFAFGYSGVGGTSRPGWWIGIKQFFADWDTNTPLLRYLFWAGVAGWADRTWDNQKRRISLMWSLLFLLCSVFPALGKVQYGHYFLPMAFFGGLISLTGVFWLQHKYKTLISPQWRGRRICYIGIPALIVLLFTWQGWNNYRYFYREKYPQVTTEQSEKKQIQSICTGCTELYVDMEYHGYLYFLSGLGCNLPFLSPYGGYFDENGHPEGAARNRNLLHSRFTENPPKAMLSGQSFSAGIAYSGLTEFVRGRYKIRDSMVTSTGEKAYLWVLEGNQSVNP
ncbi:MAG: hypothetical protein JNK73_02630 [Bacteroidia bacterium]|nr:hypothetical protein [Bacteroidia bacterium]